MPPALVSAQQPGGWVARFWFGQEVAQPPGEDRDGAAATVLEDQQVDIRIRDHGLEAQQAHGRIKDEAVPRRPRAFAGTAHLEGPGCALHRHSLDYNRAGVRSPCRVIFRCHPPLRKLLRSRRPRKDLYVFGGFLPEACGKATLKLFLSWQMWFKLNPPMNALLFPLFQPEVARCLVGAPRQFELEPPRDVGEAWSYESEAFAKTPNAPRHDHHPGIDFVHISTGQSPRTLLPGAVTNRAASGSQTGSIGPSWR